MAKKITSKPSKKMDLNKKLSDLTLKEFLSIGQIGPNVGPFLPNPDDNGPWPWGPIKGDPPPDPWKEPPPDPWVFRMDAQIAFLQHQMGQLQKEIMVLKKRR